MWERERNGREGSAPPGVAGGRLIRNDYVLELVLCTVPEASYPVRVREAAQPVRFGHTPPRGGLLVRNAPSRTVKRAGADALTTGRLGGMISNCT